MCSYREMLSRDAYPNCYRWEQDGDEAEEDVAAAHDGMKCCDLTWLWCSGSGAGFSGLRGRRLMAEVPACNIEAERMTKAGEA